MPGPTNPWDNDPVVGNLSDADVIGHNVLRKGTPPTPPQETYHPATPQERQSFGVDPSVHLYVSGSGKPGVLDTGGSDKTTYRTMTAAEKQSAGLDATQPYFVGSNGLPTLPNGAKAGAAPVDPEAARAHVSTILQSIDQASKLLDAPLTTGLPGSIFGHVQGTNAYTLRSLIGDPSDPNTPGQISGDLRQQGIAMLRALNGGNGVGTVARSQQEQQALQSAMSNIRQGLPKADLKTALGNVKQIYLRAYTRSLNLNPDDPQVAAKYGIDPLWQPPGAVQGTTQTQPQAPAPLPMGSNTPVKPGETITTSAAPPAISATTGPSAISGTEQSVVDPAVAKIAPQLEQYLAADPRKVSNAMILGFVQKNGVNPSQLSGLLPALQYRMSNEGAAWRAKGGNYGVDPRYNVPLTGISKVRAAVDASNPGGVPIGAALVGAADTASYGAVPDVAGLVHGVTGAGPSRSDVLEARDLSAAEHPVATTLGNLAGGFSPLPGAGEAGALARAGRAASTGGAYGFFGGEDPDIRSRLWNAGVGATVGLASHGAADGAGRLAQGGYRAAARPVESLINGSEATADKYALNTAARKLPTQNLADVQAADAAARKAGVPAPAAASINRAGQDYLAQAAAGSPAARAVADQVARNTAQAVPQQLAGDFNDAIQAASPAHDYTAFLNRPVREIADDVQSLASREYEHGIAPIKSGKLTVTDDLANALTHERVKSAITDALSSSRMDDETRQTLRDLPRHLQEADAATRAPSTPLGGAAAEQVAAMQQQVRDQTLKSIPLTVDAARNIATSLDRTAAKLQDGSEGGVELRRLSGQLRQAIGDQYPEFQPVNTRYASRQRAIEAMESARKNYLASTPEQMDALARASRAYTDGQNPAEFDASGANARNGGTLPSNRQFAATGAREAATVAAGENGAATASRIGNNVNQQANNATVLGQEGAQNVAARARVRADVADTVGRVASGSTNDQTTKWFDLVKRAAAAKLSGGASHYALAHAASSIPGVSNQDAARIVHLYLDTDSAPRVLNSLSQAYGARRARFIMARMAAVTAASASVRGFPVSAEK